MQCPPPPIVPPLSPSSASADTPHRDGEYYEDHASLAREHRGCDPLQRSNSANAKLNTKHIQPLSKKLSEQDRQGEIQLGAIACRLDPLLEFSYDGLSVHPYEVMFVPMSTVAIENGWSFARLAAQYETWSALQVEHPEKKRKDFFSG